MSYFVTGATGFIGRNLIEQLLEREGTIYVLVREGSRGRLEELKSSWGAGDDRIVPVIGDLSQEHLGCEDQIAELKGKIDHFFHLAAIYDITADAETQEIANVEGTRHALELAGAGFDLSSAAVRLLCDRHVGIGSDGVLARIPSETATIGELGLNYRPGRHDAAPIEMGGTERDMHDERRARPDFAFDLDRSAV